MGIRTAMSLLEYLMTAEEIDWGAVSRWHPLPREKELTKSEKRAVFEAAITHRKMIMKALNEFVAEMEQETPKELELTAIEAAE